VCGGLLTTVGFYALFVICLFSELLEYLHIERHLAAKTGTNLAVLI
jgi:hypothetical protein